MTANDALSRSILKRASRSSTAVGGVWASRYFMIDSWRAIAALGVVFSHLGFNPGFDLGHACVLLFFVISGYCIAASADSCQRNKVTGLGYMFRRVKRIYPPYLFSVLLFVATRLIKSHGSHDRQLPATLGPWIQNFTLTQWLSLVTHPADQAFANKTLFVAGYWSLNYEEQFYLVIGLLMLVSLHLKKEPLAGILVLMIPAFIWNLFFPSTVYGFFLEYWISFAVGAIVFFRLCKMTNRRTQLLLDGLLAGLFAVALVMALNFKFGGRSVYYEWAVGSAFSLLLIHVRGLDDLYRRSAAGLVLSELSLGSYSLYLTHQMNMSSSAYVSARLINMGVPAFFDFSIRTLVICLFASVFWFFCERPFTNRPLPASSARGFELSEVR